jgi:IclR family KDG regulon transcriptional repressor
MTPAIPVNTFVGQRGLGERIVMTKAPDGTVGKAMEILDSVAAVGRPVKFSELLAQSPHPKATLYRILQTLTHQGLLAHNEETGAYSLGLRLMTLAHSAWKQATLATVARPFLAAFAAKTSGPVHLAQLESGQVLFVDRIKMNARLEFLAEPGLIAPAFCTAVGKAILAHLSPERQERALCQQHFETRTPVTITSLQALRAELATIKAAGVAFDREEYQLHAIAIAAPIMNDSGRVIGAISITTSTDHHTLDDLRVFQPDLVATAKQIGDAASAWQFPAVNP